MSTVSGRASDPLAVRPWAGSETSGSKSDQYLSRRFAAATSDFRGMTLMTFLLACGVGTAIWLAAGVLVEHWVVPGGLPAWARWAWLGSAAVVVAAAAARWLVPLLLYRVNLVYVAREIERDHPDLHNDLVNAVLVRERADESAEAVVKSLRRRAARRLAKLPEQGVADRTPAVRLAWILAALVCLASVYEVLAPKSLVRSAARLMLPWSGVQPPSRVGIEGLRLAWRVPGEAPAAAGDAARTIDVVGGTAEIVRGRQLVVSAEIHGLSADDTPLLVVTPLLEDGGGEGDAAGWQMPLAVGTGGRRTVVVPGDDRGLDQPIDLMIAAGDARSERIRVIPLDAPAVLVREVRYEYPAYMNREPETVTGQGDIHGVEGARVTLVAASNRPLATAAVDLGCDGRRDVPLALGRPDDTVGSGTFMLRLNANRDGPEFSAYRFVYRPRANPTGRPEGDLVGSLEHRIEVVPDLAPELAIEVPEQKRLRVPPDAPVTVRVRAGDPDFGLASVRLETRLAGGDVRRGEELLVGGPRKAAVLAGTILPSTLRVKPGETLEYRAVAADTRPDEPNEAVTEWRALEIDASAPPQPSQDGPADRRDDATDEPQGDAAGAGSQDAGEQQGPQQQQQQGESQEQGEQAGRDPQGRQSQGQQQQKGQQPDESKPGDQEGEQRGDEGKQPAGGSGKTEGRQGRDEGSSQEPGEGQGGRQGDQAGDGRDGQWGDGQGAAGQAGDQQTVGREQSRGAAARAGRGHGEPRPDQESGGGERKPDPAVASDGTDDGEAMDRILENRRRSGSVAGDEDSQEWKQEQGREGVGQTERGEGDGRKVQNQQVQGEQGQGEQGQGEKGQGEKGQGEKGQGEQGQGEKGQGEQGQGEKGQGEKGQGEKGQGERGQGEQAGGAKSGDIHVGQGGATGDEAQQGGAGGPLPERRDMEWAAENLDHARNAADLAVEHLRNSLDKGRTDLLDELGWTPEQARAFLDRWKAMQRLAGSDDPRERARYEQAVRSLGLRPDGVRRSRDVPTDVRGGQAEGRRSRPPSDYREQFKAFMQGTSSP